MDLSVPFGLRIGSMICQRATDAIRYLMSKDQIRICNYVDDLVGCSHTHRARVAYIKLRDTLRELGLQEAPGKLSPPDTSVDFIGITFDTQLMETSMDMYHFVRVSHGMLTGS